LSFITIINAVMIDSFGGLLANYLYSLQSNSPIEIFAYIFTRF